MSEYSSHGYGRHTSSSSHAHGSHHHHRHSKRKRRRRIIVGAIVAVLVVVLGVSCFSLYTSAKNLKNQVSSAKAGITAMQVSLTSDDTAGLSANIKDLQATVSDMKSELDGPLWTVIQFVPVVGQDVRSAKVIVSSLNQVTEEVLVPFPDVLGQSSLADLVREDHSIDVNALASLAAFAQKSAPVMDQAIGQIEDLPDFHLVQLKEAIGPATERLVAINDALQGVAAIAPTVNGLLGADGTRHYLLVAQNSSEIRSLGGFPGSVGTVTVADGSIQLGSFKRVYDVLSSSIPEGLEPTEQELAMFCCGDASFLRPHDAEVNPDFPRVAKIWAASYADRNGIQPDGVISMTPTVVQCVLAAAGSITLSDGTVLDGTNATRALEYEMYDKYLNNPETRAIAAGTTDDLFAETAEKAFDKLFESFNANTLVKLAESLGQAASNREIFAWMADDAEQQAMETMGIDGSLSRDSSNKLGVFYNDIYGSKMGWFIDAATVINSKSAGPNGSTVYSVTTRLVNTITQKEAELFDGYITGWHKGVEMFALYLYAPTGGAITGISSTDNLEFIEDNHCGRQVFYVHEGVLPVGGGFCTINYQVEVPAGAGELEVQDTPTLTQYR